MVEPRKATDKTNVWIKQTRSAGELVSCGTKITSIFLIGNHVKVCEELVILEFLQKCEIFYYVLTLRLHTFDYIRFIWMHQILLILHKICCSSVHFVHIYTLVYPSFTHHHSLPGQLQYLLFDFVSTPTSCLYNSFSFNASRIIS